MEDNKKTRISTKQETPTITIQRTRFGYRYAYARALECRNLDDTGQDYLVVFENEDKLSFVLCDGVSQSFYGDLAARRLGEILVEWMFNTPMNLTKSVLEVELNQILKRLTESVTNQIMEFQLPEDLAPMVQNALEKKRPLGSESTFITGRIDFETKGIILSWMGDSILRIWRQNNEITSVLGDTFLKDERWSSLKGPVGHIHCFVGSIDQITHIAAYSDGLKKLNSKMKMKAPSGHAIDVQIEEAGEDDISLFEFWTGKLPTFEIVTPKKPIGLEVKQRNNLKNLIWNQVSNATYYEIEFSTKSGEMIYRQSTLPYLEIKANELPENLHSLRVRAWQDEEPGDWSNGFLLSETVQDPLIGLTESLPPEFPPEMASTQPSLPPQPKEPLPLPLVPVSTNPVTINQSDKPVPIQLPINQEPSFKSFQPKQKKGIHKLLLIGLVCLAAMVFLISGIIIGINIKKSDVKITPTEAAETIIPFPTKDSPLETTEPVITVMP